MSDDPRLVSDLDRMLALRQVPLFRTLVPEDLQRIAATARETSWTAGDVLMAQGDIGHELIVIVEGSVSVLVDDGDTERLVRTCVPGDHIGELAVLRDAPRSATVVADAGGVLGLVLDGEAVRALLLERPYAAMALLGTLADRLSR
jgi:CRP-like cAMP-binding protein